MLDVFRYGRRGWIKLRILFNEEEVIKMIRKLVGVIKIE